MIDMLAAGNRVMVKPSEFAPACASLLQEMVEATFDRDLVDVVVGGLDLAREFTWGALGPPALHRQLRGSGARSPRWRPRTWSR